MRLLLIVIFCSAAFIAQAQYFQFSQFNFAKQRINPAYVASSNYASVSVLSRDQATDGGFHLNSNFVNASYPFIARKSGKRWSELVFRLWTIARVQQEFLIHRKLRYRMP